MNDLILTQPSRDIIPTIEKMIENDPRLVSLHSQAQYKSHLKGFMAWCNGRIITKLLVEAYLADLNRQGLAPQTINQRLAAIRWYARKVADLAIENGDEAHAGQLARVALVKNVKGNAPEKGRLIRSEEHTSELQSQR